MDMAPGSPRLLARAIHPRARRHRTSRLRKCGSKSAADSGRSPSARPQTPPGLDLRKPCAVGSSPKRYYRRKPGKSEQNRRACLFLILGSLPPGVRAHLDAIILESRLPSRCRLLLLPRVRRGFFLGQATNDVSGPIPGEDLRDIGLVAAFELPDLPGAALFRYQWRLPEPAHRNWRAIGFELQFIFLAIFIRRGTGDTGNHSHRA